MVKILLILTVLCMAVSMSLPVFARNTEEVCETAYDTLRGANSDCPLILQPYIAKTWKDAFNKKADVRVELGYEFNSHKIAGDNQVNLKFGLEY